MKETGPEISSDGEPELKTNYKSLAKRYELAERQVWSKTPDWKRKVIVDCKINETDDRIFNEYAKEIRLLAEDDSVKFSDSLPEVPATPKAAKIPDPAVT